MSRLIAAPIETPPIPCVLSIPGGPTIGLVIQIQGKVPHNAKRFEVNLATGARITEPGLSNIAFHFNPRFNKSNYVARNTLVDGVWGKEEYADPSTLPFSQNQAFEIMILFEAHEYKVAVNGSHFLQYTHRLPFYQVTTLQILGDVNIFKIEFLNSCSQVPATYIGLGSLSSPPVQMQEIINPSIPFRHAIVGGLKPGRSIFITGRPKPYGTRFHINLEKSGMAGQMSQICFHFNPRFGGMGDEPNSVIIRNSFENGQWGNEERHTPFFPFHHGFNFDLTILCEVLDFMVAVNGQHLVSYKHRLPYEIVDALSIEGDVDVMLAKVQ